MDVYTSIMNDESSAHFMSVADNRASK
jgi:hypothetical protein